MEANGITCVAKWRTSQAIIVVRFSCHLLVILALTLYVNSFNNTRDEASIVDFGVAYGSSILWWGNTKQLPWRIEQRTGTTS